MLTLELRWFVAEPIADSELRAFAKGGYTEARVDHYLLETGDDHGVKRRGSTALLEHKRCLTRTPVTLTIDDMPLSGIAECWHKHWPELPPNEGAWVAVDKRRALRRVRSCRAELTRLRLEPLTPVYTSLAIESTTIDAEPLVRAAATLLRVHPRLAAALRDAISCGYPAWLARIRWP